MSRPSQVVLIPVMVAVTSVLSWGTDTKTQSKTADAPHTVSPAATDRQAEQTPGVQQMPAAAPIVTYSGDQLTIVGQNATLADILSAVCKLTGVAIDIPRGSGSERIASRVGPGSTRDVLAALLNGSHFDYAMIGSPSNPTAIERIVLIPRSNESETAAPTDNPATALDLREQQPSPPPVPAAQALPQPTQEHTAEAQTSSDDGDEAVDESELPTTEMRSVAEDPLPEPTVQQPQVGGLQMQPTGQPASPGQMPQTFPQPPGSNPQRPGNGDTPPPPPPH